MSSNRSDIAKGDCWAHSYQNVSLRQYRTNELVRRRMNFSSDAMADFEGLLEVNRKICKQQMAEKASPTLPTNCAVLPVETENGNTYNGLIKQSGACLS